MDSVWKTKFLGPVSQFITDFLWLFHFLNSQFLLNIKKKKYVVSSVNETLLSFSFQIPV